MATSETEPLALGAGPRHMCRLMRAGDASAAIAGDGTSEAEATAEALLRVVERAGMEREYAANAAMAAPGFVQMPPQAPLQAPAGGGSPGRTGWRAGSWRGVADCGRPAACAPSLGQLVSTRLARNVAGRWPHMWVYRGIPAGPSRTADSKPCQARGHGGPHAAGAVDNLARELRRIGKRWRESSWWRHGEEE